MKKLRFFTFILVLLTTSIKAQDLSTQKLPKLLKIPTEEVNSISLSDAIAGGNTGEIWIAYALRDGAPCYALPNASKTIHTLNFMDVLYVYDVVGDYLNVRKRLPTVDFILDDSDLQDYGWVKKEDLLLWSHCIVTNDKKKVAIKGMVINKIDYIKKKEGKIKLNSSPKNDEVPFYLDPMLAKESGRYSQMFNILYVYATYPQNSSIENAQSVLLGIGDRIMTPKKAKEAILGWIPADRVTFWKHRVAVELNFEEKAVEERKLNKTPVVIFANNEKGIQKAKLYGQSKADGQIKGYTFKGNYDKNRKIGTWMRFPVLKNDKVENLYTLGVMGEITDKTGKTIFNRDTGSEVTQGIQQKIKDRRHVNIVFVIDGTTSMQPYFNTLANTLSRSIDNIESENPANLIKYGVTVYRDAAEGNRLIENLPLTASKEKIINFLKRIKAVDVFDKDKPEAVFYGLKQALISQFKNENETNILILVGDAGNHTQLPKTKVNPDFLSDLISKKGCSVLAYQVHNEGDQTYIDFQNQIKDVLLNAANQTYENNKIWFDATGISYEKPFYSKKENNTFVLENYPPLALVVTSPTGGSIEPKVLANKINEIIVWSQDYLESLITRLTDLMNGKTSKEVTAENNKNTTQQIEETGNKYVSSYAPGVLDLLASLNISEETMKKLCKEKFQLYTRGIAPKKILGQTYPLFKRNLLMSNMDLLEIIQDIQKINDALSYDDRRQALVNTWIELLNKYYGNMNEADLKNMSIEEVQEKVFGISPQSGNFLYKYRLRDLTDPSVVSDKELNQYVRQIYGKYNRLMKIQNDKNYPYSFYINDVTYYWIIEDYLP